MRRDSDKIHLNGDAGIFGLLLEVLVSREIRDKNFKIVTQLVTQDKK